jgi:hypothetical protein
MKAIWQPYNVFTQRFPDDMKAIWQPYNVFYRHLFELDRYSERLCDKFTKCAKFDKLLVLLVLSSNKCLKLFTDTCNT